MAFYLAFTDDCEGLRTLIIPSDDFLHTPTSQHSKTLFIGLTPVELQTFENRYINTHKLSELTSRGYNSAYIIDAEPSGHRLVVVEILYKINLSDYRRENINRTLSDYLNS